MSNNRIMQHFHVIFSVFMVLFYLGAGIFLLFFAKQFNIDKAIRGILGASFMFYGFYRGFTTYRLVVDAFSSKDDEDD